jgi:hypothetical protein
MDFASNHWKRCLVGKCENHTMFIAYLDLSSTEN